MHIIKNITTLSNITFLLPIYTLFVKSIWIEFIILIIGIFISSMYHHSDSNENRSILLSRSNWHKLDNIMAVEIILSHMLYLSKIDFYQSLYLHLVGFFITIIFQLKNPWDIENVIYPSIIGLMAFVYKLIFFNNVHYKINNIYNLCILLPISLFFFFKGLSDDDFKGNRIYHSFWHFFAGLSSFILLSCIE